MQLRSPGCGGFFDTVWLAVSCWLVCTVAPATAEVWAIASGAAPSAMASTNRDLLTMIHLRGMRDDLHAAPAPAGRQMSLTRRLPCIQVIGRKAHGTVSAMLYVSFPL